MKINFLISLLILSSLLFIPTAHSSNDIQTWCNRTPHPEPCEYCISRYPRPLSPKHATATATATDFRNLMVQVALEIAHSAKSYASQFEGNCKNEHQKAAWTDCLKLFDDTVYQLNRTLQGLLDKTTDGKSCTNFDAQTWLSAALTNIHTCLDGSKVLHVSDFITPIYMSNNNVSEIISNSLAIGSQLLEKEKNQTTTTDEFEEHESYPSWVSNHDRRLLAASSVKANLVVAKDGSGHFWTVQAALDFAAKRKRRNRYIILVKKGVYRENIQVSKTNGNIMLVGDSLRYTIITGSRSAGGGYTTFSSATAGIDGPGFIARGITFTNTAGAMKGQAVALRSSSDLSVIYRCSIQGYQDTLFVHSQRQFYRESYIYGTIDFIFGNAAVVFQSCLIYVRKPIYGQVNVITAQARNDPFQNTGISIQNSQVRAAPDLQPVLRYYKTYLGRPWMQFSRVVFMKCYLDSLVDPAGWLEWQKTNFALSTLYYGEYKNFGPASSTRYRVKWPGFHVITSANVATSFTAGRLIAGRSWLPATGVPFSSGL